MRKTIEKETAAASSEESYKLAENTLRILANRRSCRSFLKDQLTKQEIEILLQAGYAAPIGMNRVNDILLFVIQNKELLDELEENTKSYYEKNHFVRSAIYETPTLIIVAVKELTGAYQKGQYCSAACLLENMIVAATEMELGTVYLGGVTSALNQNLELLNKIGIPADYEAASALAVGRTEQIFAQRNLSEERIATKWIN